jgi:exopolysaccharide production protein ExoZ
MMKTKLELLQIGRGLAAILVVMLHITGHADYYLHFTLFANIFTVGWTGVDFFFVLSGFIIYHIHKDDLGRPKKLSLYVKKRLIRIYPIYWVIASVALVLALMNKDHISNEALSGSMTDIPYLVKSYLLIHDTNRPPFLGVAWSLCYEMFFYFVFGIAILFGKRTLAVFSLVFLIAIFGIRFVPAAFAPWLYLLPSNFNIEFVFGMAAAWLSSMAFWDRTRRSTAVICLTLGILLFLTAYVLAYFDRLDLTKTSLNSRLAFGLGAFLVVLAASRLRLKNKNRFSDFLMLLGDASYVLYLSHPVVLAVFFKIYSKTKLHNNLFSGVVLCIVSFAIAIGAAILIHLKIERKINNYLSGIFIRRQATASQPS